VLAGDITQRAPQVGDPLAGQRVVDPGAVPSGGQQPSAGHRPKVVRGVGHALADLFGDVVNGSFALGEDVDDLGPPAAGQRLGDLRETVEERVLGGSVTHGAIVRLPCHYCQEFK